jgi:Mrp family chromosome partitioning ATPase
MPRPLVTAAFVLVCLCLGAVAGATVASTAPAEYRAESTLLVHGAGLDRLLDPSGLELSLDDLFSDQPGARSPALLRSLLRSASGPADPAQTIVRTAKLDEIADLAAQRSSSEFTAAQFKDAIDASADSARGTVTIAATTDTPALSSNLANAYADSLVAYLSDGQVARLRDLRLALRRLSANVDTAGLGTRETRTLKQLADDSYAKLKLLDATNSQQPPASVLTPADRSTSSDGASVPAGAAVGAALGLLLAALLLGLRRLWRVSTNNWAADPSRSLGAPVLATVDAGDLEGRMPRDIEQLPPSAIVLANAVTSRLEESGARTVAVCSARDESLTKPVAWALACVLAERHERVLLVESNTSRPGFSVVHGLDHSGGLRALDEFARDRESVPDDDGVPAVESRAVVETIALASGRSVDLVAAGEDDRRAEDLASDPVLEGFLDDAILRYDRVVLEAPTGAEGASLAAKLKHAFVLARVGSVSRRAIRAELAALRQRDAEVLGLVVVGDGDGVAPTSAEPAQPEPAGRV